ncbi:MAG TPA: RluA family pseudouridine synthase [Clostridiales bacterium]|nr:RluA family pseudouridine synthase [Clostridiales bacterium]
MKSFTINKNDSGQRLDKFVAKTAPLLPQSLLYKYIRLKRIKINNKRAEISTKLSVGDVVDMYIGDEFFAQVERKYDFMSASKQLDIVYEDENIMLLDKKVGLLSHPDNEEYSDTLITRVKRYLYEKGEYNPDDEASFSPALANRIDRNTGGIVIAAKNAEALRDLNNAIKNREITKLYICVCIGKLKKSEDTLEGYLFKDEKKNQVFVSKEEKPNSKYIETHYRVIDYKNGLSLCEVNLLTGRSHQIRAHFASIGHPLLGDAKYGINAQNNANKNYKKQFLYSYKLIFSGENLGSLGYLKGNMYQINNIWFVEEFKNNKL